MFAELKKIEAEWKARMHKALSFDGVDDYVEVADSASLDITDEITITAWINAKTIDNRDEIVSKVYFSGGYALRLMANGKLNFHFNNGEAWQSFYSTGTIATNAWYFVTVVYSSSQGGKFYINGVASGDILASGNIVTNDVSVFIGTEANPNYRDWFNGIIDEVRIYNRALSESEIKYLYYNPFDPIDPDHLVLWLNPAGIDIANSKWWDLSGKGNHGTIHGATEVKLVEKEVIV